MPQRLNSKQRPLASEFYFRFQFRYVCSYGNLPVCDHIRNFSVMTHKSVAVLNAVLKKLIVLYVCNNWRSADPETLKVAEPYFRSRI